MGAAVTPKKQGSRFETTLQRLLLRLLGDDLDLADVHCIREMEGGGQGGRDLQLRWRNTDGRARQWHVECKSHARKTLPDKEVGGHLFKAARNPHRVDVWCLALSNAEPSTDLDLLLESAPRLLALPFALAVLSPQRANLRWLYACHPDLYAEQYGESAPALTPVERERTVATFGRWLEEQSARRPPHTPSGWTSVEPEALELRPDDPDHARAYLRGLTPTCPWEAVAYGWTVERTELERRLRATVEDAPAGVTWEWLVGGTGEGKSTVLRRLAWQIAAEDPERRVLWGEDGTPCSFPVAWISALPSGARVLICVDGTYDLSGLAEGLAHAEAWAAEDKRVSVLLVDRGNRWRMNRRRLLPSRLRRDPRRLQPLCADERLALARLLDARALLHGTSVDEAVARLEEAYSASQGRGSGRRTERQWLVPTLMQLTDPGNRPFEVILRSLLHQLEDDGQRDALRVLLAISLVHAAGFGLPRDLGERLVGDADAFATAISVVEHELDAQDLDGWEALGGARDYRTHGAVVSAGLVRGAATEPLLRERLLNVCRDLPLTTKPEYTAQGCLRQDRFDVVDAVVTFLDDVLQDTGAAIATLDSWLTFDEEGFPCWSRLGLACTHAVEDAVIHRRSATREQLLAVAERSRVAYRTALRTALRQLTRRPRADPYVGTDLQHSLGVICHSWSVLESLLGTPGARKRGIGGDDSSRRALYLALLSLRAPTDSQERVWGIMAQTLLDLGEDAVAAQATAVLEAFAGRDNYVAAKCRRRLEARHVAVPQDGEPLLGAVVEQLIALIDAGDGLPDLGAPLGDGRALLHDALEPLAARRPTDAALARAVEALARSAEAAQEPPASAAGARSPVA